MSLRYLVLGDGNFTFSLSLRQKLLGSGVDDGATVVATCFESLERVRRRAKTEETLKELSALPGVVVLHDVDATKLNSCEHLKRLELTFDVVVFNFPHTGGKNKIQLNRSLLRATFKSATSCGLLAGEGEVQVTLCQGQGGTPADADDRGYHNSWKVAEMAAEGGFVLRRIEVFCPLEYPGYVPTGYRGHTDRGFCVDGALRHVFKRPTPSHRALYPTRYSHDVSFWWHKDEEFDEESFRHFVRRVVGDCVQEVTCIGQYRPDPVASRSPSVSYCYRLVYSPTWDALSRGRAGQLQQLLRVTMETELGVQLR